MGARTAGRARAITVHAMSHGTLCYVVEDEKHV
jgi:hypothetical protein